ncbi:hypothetical protein ACFL2T_07825 [Elusimicrobiota bacterium]
MKANPRKFLLTPTSPEPLAAAIGRLAALLVISEKDARRRIDEVCRGLGTDGKSVRRWTDKRQESARNWLLSLAAFDLDLDVRTSAEAIGQSLSTAHRTKRTIREALVALDPGWREVLLSPERMASGEPVIFGLKLNGGPVRVRPMLDPDMLSTLRMRPPSIVHLNGFTYTAPYQKHDALVFGGRWPEVFESAPTPGRRGKDPFLRFLMNCVSKRNGISPRDFPLHLKEWEVRFNHLGDSIFPILIDAVCRSVPD